MKVNLLDILVIECNRIELLELTMVRKYLLELEPSIFKELTLE